MKFSNGLLAVLSAAVMAHASEEKLSLLERSKGDALMLPVCLSITISSSDLMLTQSVFAVRLFGVKGSFVQLRTIEN